MQYSLGSLVVFEEEGPAVIAEVRNLQTVVGAAPKWRFLFKSLREKSKGKPREFFVSLDGLKNAKFLDTNFCRWVEDEHLTHVKKGDEVFVLLRGRMNHAIYRGTKGNKAIIHLYGSRDYEYEVDKCLVIYYYHSWEHVANGVHNCSKCGAVRTQKYQPKKGYQRNGRN